MAELVRDHAGKEIVLGGDVFGLSHDPKDEDPIESVLAILSTHPELEAALRHSGGRLKLVRADVDDLTLGEDVQVHLEGMRLHADAAVLAVGNLPPHDPPGLDAHSLSADRYKGDPWHVSVPEGLTDRDTVVVVGVGITSNIEVAQRSGVTVDNGVLVDEYCRTNVPNIFAAGDIANHYHPLFDELIRVEHFDNANKQAAAAANNMLGNATIFDDPHWFWSDQYDLNIQHTGHARSWDELVIRGSVDELDFCAFYLREGRIRAAFAVDRGSDVALAKELISGRVTVDPRRLKDEDVDLSELLETEQTW